MFFLGGGKLKKKNLLKKVPPLLFWEKNFFFPPPPPLPPPPPPPPLQITHMLHPQSLEEFPLWFDSVYLSYNIIECHSSWNQSMKRVVILACLSATGTNFSDGSRLRPLGISSKKSGGGGGGWHTFHTKQGSKLVQKHLKRQWDLFKVLTVSLLCLCYKSV